MIKRHIRVQTLVQTRLAATVRGAALAATLTTALVAGIGLTGCGSGSDAKLIASAKTLMAKKDNEAAKLQLKSLLQNNPQSAEARYLLGQVLHDTGDMAGAEAEFRRALESGHPEATVLPPLASTMVALGKGALCCSSSAR